MSRLRSLRKIDVVAYLLVLFGLAVVTGGLYAGANPKFEATTEPASGYLYVVAGIGTVAFLVLLVLRFAAL